MATVFSKYRDQALILAAAIGFTVYQIIYWSDPWSSWGHIEAVFARPMLEAVVSGSWSNILRALIDGTGIDPNPLRFRPVSHAVELFDAHLGAGLLRYWFVPAFANISTVIYLIVCPVIAFAIARKLLGSGPLATLILIVTVASLLTSVGFVSAGGFIFRPAKKIVIIGALLQIFLLISYRQSPRARTAVLASLCQLLISWADESGLVAGLSISGFLILVAFAKGRIADAISLALIAVVTLLGFPFRFLLFASPPSASGVQDVGGAIKALLSVNPFGPFNLAGGHIEAAWYDSETYSSVMIEHFEGAFGVLYGAAGVRWALLLAIVLAMVVAAFVSLQLSDEPIAMAASAGRRRVSFLIISGGLLLLNVAGSVALLAFGGRIYMSAFNFYYASDLPVFSFFFVVELAACLSITATTSGPVLRRLSDSVRCLLIIAVAAQCISNMENLPRLNRLVAELHFNPFSYAQVNLAASQSMATKSAPVTISRCTSAALEERFTSLLDSLNIRNLGTRHDFTYYPSRPFVDEWFLRSYLTLLTGAAPNYQFREASPGEC